MNSEEAERFNSAAAYVSPKLRDSLLALPLFMKVKAQEIRLRAGKPVCIWCAQGAFFLRGTQPVRMASDLVLTVSAGEIEETFRSLCEDSVYSHENEIRRGFLALRGGNRAGICGTAVVHGGEVTGFRDISSINLRIAREKPGCADELFEDVGVPSGGGLLLCGPPCSGKTTLLRDIARQLSDGTRGDACKVVIVDERGELAGCRNGMPQNDVGRCCDVLDGCPKAEGILIAVRTLSPQVIVCDELGSAEETAAVKQSLNAGVCLVASIHAGSAEELLHREQGVSLLKTGAFRKIVFLAGGGEPGKIAGIYESGDLLGENFRDSASDCRRLPRGMCGILPAEAARGKTGSLSEISFGGQN